MSECGRRRCRLAASETQPEPVSIQQRCHGPQHAVSLSPATAAPRGSSGSNGDVDVFRQSVYLKLMLSNRSQSYPSPPPPPPLFIHPAGTLRIHDTMVPLQLRVSVYHYCYYSHFSRKCFSPPRLLQVPLVAFSQVPVEICDAAVAAEGVTCARWRDSPSSGPPTWLFTYFCRRVIL